MTIDSAWEFLPKNEKAPQHAFDIINNKYPNIQTIKDILSLDQQELSQLVSNYFTSGVAYFANLGHDKFMESLGDTTWMAVNKKMVLTIMASNVMSGLLQMGLPAEDVFNEMLNRGVSRLDMNDLLKAKITINGLMEKYPNLNEMYILFAQHGQGKTKNEVAYVLVPPEFVIRCKQNPIEGLATMAYICSQVVDFVNGRLLIDQSSFNQRSNIYEAHFLIEALRLNPQTKISEFYRRLVTKFPKGINSENIDKKLFYRSGMAPKGNPTSN